MAKLKTGSKSVVVNVNFQTNAGTSEGAKKGWETREGGSPEAQAASEKANNLSKDIFTRLDTPEQREKASKLHVEAAKLHQRDADVYEKAGNIKGKYESLRQRDIHEQSSKAHTLVASIMREGKTKGAGGSSSTPRPWKNRSGFVPPAQRP